MKNYFVYLALLGACLACSSADTEPKDSLLAKECDYDSRKTVSTITNQKGTIRVMPAGSETWTDIYLDGTNSTPYCACNLPASFSEEGLRVTLSAEVKETYPNEKWRCQPIKLTALALDTTTQK
jgi:hypothetical protein